MRVMRYRSGKPDAEKKKCFDCDYCQAYLSWWCINNKAIESRGTRIPGVHGCPYWKPALKVRWWEYILNWISLFSYMVVINLDE